MFARPPSQSCACLSRELWTVACRCLHSGHSFRHGSEPSPDADPPSRLWSQSFVNSVIQTVSRALTPQGSCVTMSPDPGFRPVVSALTKGIPDNVSWTGLAAPVSSPGQDPHQVSAHHMWDSLRASHGRWSSGQVPCWCVDPCISVSQLVTCACTLTQMLTRPPLSGFSSSRVRWPRQFSRALSPLGLCMTRSPVSGLRTAVSALTTKIIPDSISRTHLSVPTSSPGQDPFFFTPTC